MGASRRADTQIAGLIRPSFVGREAPHLPPTRCLGWSCELPRLLWRPFDPRGRGRSYEIFRLDALAERFDVARLPYSIKVLLENVLRLEDGVSVTADAIEAIAGWDADAEPSVEIPFQPARVLMQDFTGVPAVVDLAAMRDAMAEIGGDPRRSTRWSTSTW